MGTDVPNAPGHMQVAGSNSYRISLLLDYGATGSSTQTAGFDKTDESVGRLVLIKGYQHRLVSWFSCCRWLLLDE